MDEQNTNTLIDNKIAELTDLYTRMDDTRDLLYLTPYEMKGFDDKKLNNVMNVTTNRPAVIVQNLVSDLMSAKWQVVVEGVSQRQQHYIESFAQDGLDQIDEQLGISGGYTLFDWFANHVCSRGIIGARFITTIDKDKYEIDCLPVDMRWCPFEFGKKALEWGANRTFRSAAQIKKDYPEWEGSAANYWFGGYSKDIEVRDFWNTKVNEVWIGGNKVKEQKNPFGQVPFVIVLPASGFMLRDSGYMKYEAEDALFLDINLFKTESQILTIQQTLGFGSIKPPYQKIVKQMDGEPPDAPPDINETIKVGEGEEYKLLPRGDVNRAFMTAHQDIQALIEQGARTYGDLGSAGLDRPGVWFTAQNEIRNKALMPRLKALARAKEQTIRMLIEQYRVLAKQTKKEKIEIGRSGKRRSYSIQQIGDPKDYFVSCSLKPQSKAQDVENLAQAITAKQLGMPMKQILTNILQVEDPDGVMREIEVEQAENANPVLKYANQGLRLIEQAESIQDNTIDDERNANTKLMFSRMLCRMCIDALKLQFQPPMPQASSGGGTNALAALIAQGGKGGGRQPPKPQLPGGLP